jgi:hypothetical protein
MEGAAIWRMVVSEIRKLVVYSLKIKKKTQCKTQEKGKFVEFEND